MSDELIKVEDVKTALMYEGENEEKYMEQYEEITCNCSRVSERCY